MIDYLFLLKHRADSLSIASVDPEAGWGAERPERVSSGPSAVPGRLPQVLGQLFLGAEEGAGSGSFSFANSPRVIWRIFS